MLEPASSLQELVLGVLELALGISVVLAKVAVGVVVEKLVLLLVAMVQTVASTEQRPVNSAGSVVGEAWGSLWVQP